MQVHHPASVEAVDHHWWHQLVEVGELAVGTAYD